MQSHLLTSAQTISTYIKTLSEHLLPLPCWLEGAIASLFFLPFLEKATFTTTLAIGRVLKTLPLLYLGFNAGAPTTILPLPLSVNLIAIALENYHL